MLEQTVEPRRRTLDLEADCRRILVRAARSESAGSRKRVRAPARRFVRRHRGNAGYLRWVLRSVAASAALAVTLLGFGAQTASADATLFAERVHTRLRDSPMGRPIAHRPSSKAQVIGKPRVGGLHHRYEWREAA
jgi:hypothetical protein